MCDFDKERGKYRQIIDGIYHSRESWYWTFQGQTGYNTPRTQVETQHFKQNMRKGEKDYGKRSYP